MLGEAKELLLNEEGILKEGLTFHPILDAAEEYHTRLLNLAIEVCTCMYMYTHAYICVCMYVHVHRTYTYMYTSIYVHLCVLVCQAFQFAILAHHNSLL